MALMLPVNGSLHAAGRPAAWGRWRWNHQPQSLEQQDGALGRTSPDKLAAFTLAILDVDVSARILEAAILEFAIHKNAFIKNYVLAFKNLVLKPVHRVARQILSIACHHAPHHVWRIQVARNQSAAMRLPSKYGVCKSPHSEVRDTSKSCRFGVRELAPASLAGSKLPHSIIRPSPPPCYLAVAGS